MPLRLSAGYRSAAYCNSRSRATVIVCRVDGIHRRIAKNIRLLAERRGIAITHLPDLAGVGRSSFFNVLAGRGSPTVRWLQLVATALDADVADLTAKSRR